MSQNIYFVQSNIFLYAKQRVMAVSHWLILKWLTFIIPCLQQGVPEAVIFNLQNRFEGVVAVFLV